MKKLFASLLAAASILAPSVAMAGNTPEDHLKLWKELQNQGVTTIYNHKVHCDGDSDGKYYIYSAMLIVCQDNMTNHLEEHTWTDNDFDTLRHEAHHVVQDCAYGSIGDGKTGPIFNYEELAEFLKLSSWSQDRLIILYNTLEEGGLDEISIQEEMEAYVVASDISATVIGSKLIEFCSE